jgi:hypothetical protein
MKQKFLSHLKIPFFTLRIFISHKIKPRRVKIVRLPSTPERQNLSIYLGYKNVAMLHREGQEDLPLEIDQCN